MSSMEDSGPQPEARSRAVVPCHFLVGPTAAGKSEVAHLLAKRHQWPLLSADSMQVYERLDVGTAKPTPAERASHTYAGIDLVPPDQPFSVGAYIDRVRGQITRPDGPEPPWLVVGGTGLYLKALACGLAEAPPVNHALRAACDRVLQQGGVAALQSFVRSRAPEHYAALADPANPRRLVRALESATEGGAAKPAWDHEQAAPVPGLRWEREALNRRITARVRAMFDHGLVEEVRSLREDYPELSATAADAIGYREAAAVLDGTLTEAAAIQASIVRTRQYAKRQMTWFRRQLNVLWIDCDEATPPEAVADEVAACWEREGPLHVQL